MKPKDTIILQIFSSCNGIFTILSVQGATGAASELGFVTEYRLKGTHFSVRATRLEGVRIEPAISCTAIREHHSGMSMLLHIAHLKIFSK